MSHLYQIELENLYSTYNTPKYLKKIMKDMQPDIDACANNLRLYCLLFDEYEYTTEAGVTKQREDLIEIHTVLAECDIEELFYKMYSVVIPNRRVTLQAVAGSVINQLDEIESYGRRLKAVELLLKYIPFLEILLSKGAEYGYVVSLIELEPEEADILSRQGKALPSIVPMAKVFNNSTVGYHTFTKSIIMGGKHHDQEVCLQHINRCNSVAFRTDPRVFKMLSPEFDPTPKLNKKSGLMETKMDIQKRKKSWISLYSSMPHKLALLNNLEFYFAHRYCNRGRTYVEGYEINYQGDGFQKSLINLSKKETIKPEW